MHPLPAGEKLQDIGPGYMLLTSDINEVPVSAPLVIILLAPTPGADRHSLWTLPPGPTALHKKNREPFAPSCDKGLKLSRHVKFMSPKTN
jgi:hypothetical protein